MAKEYIEREAAISVLRRLVTPNKSPAQREMIRTGEMGIQRIPAADVGEVVRCKGCKYYEIGKDYEPYCNHWASMLAAVNEGDFCSYGERRDNG